MANNANAGDEPFALFLPCVLICCCCLLWLSNKVTIKSNKVNFLIKSQQETTNLQSMLSRLEKKNLTYSKKLNRQWFVKLLELFSCLLNKWINQKTAKRLHPHDKLFFSYLFKQLRWIFKEERSNCLIQKVQFDVVYLKTTGHLIYRRMCTFKNQDKSSNNVVWWQTDRRCSNHLSLAYQ